MTSTQIYSALALPVVLYLIFRVSRWRDRMMREDGFSAGGRPPAADAWIDRKLQEVRVLLRNNSFDSFEIAGVMASVIQAEATTNNYLSHSERKFLKLSRQVIEASARNPTLARMGYLSQKEISAVHPAPNAVFDFFVDSYAESKSVFHLENIEDLQTVSNIVVPRFVGILKDYRKSTHSTVDKRMAVGCVLLLRCIMYFSSVNESFFAGHGYQEFGWDVTGSRFVRDTIDMISSLEKKFSEVESASDDGLEAILSSLVD